MDVSEFFTLPEPRTEREKFSGKIVSYSQYKMWATCPWQWKLSYVDKHRTYEDNINSVFGSAMHDTIQAWMPLHFSDEKRAKSIDLDGILEKYLKERFRLSIQEVEGKKVYICDAATMATFYKQGCEILMEVQKYGREFFPTKNCKLIGCEIPLEVDIMSGVRFLAYLDIVIHDEAHDEYHIWDLKTSTRGWFKYQKTDPLKTHQLLFYKDFYSKQFNVPVENIIPHFLILKREIQLKEFFIIRRLSKFDPSHGKISLKKATTAFADFIKECFSSQGEYIPEQKPTPSESNCKYCPFKDNASLCPSSYYLRKKDSLKTAKKMLTSLED